MQDELIVVDVKDVLRILDPDRNLDPSTFESWFARSCTNSFSIPSVSATLLGMSDGISSMRELEKRANKQRINPLDYLPDQREFYYHVDGLWFLLADTTLYVGKRRDVERILRELTAAKFRRTF